jgi:O-antigen ligase
VVVVMAIVAPAGYFQRMNTVTEYQQDNSAQARIQAWTAGLHMALDHPMGVGAGNFASVHGRYYMPSDEDNRVGWGGRRWANAHSIYFKVLGEYGFPGLAMLLLTIFTLMQHNTASRRAILAAPEGAPFTDYWPAFVNMSTIAFAVCGIFLGGFNYPHLFVLTGICIAIRRVIRLEWAGGASQTVPARPSPVARTPAVPVMPARGSA